MKTSERHHLKENEFATTVAHLSQTAATHQRSLVLGAAALLLVAVVAVGYWFWQRQRLEQASTLLGANRKDMDLYLGKAMQREPREIIHPVTYAFTLLDIGADTAPKATTLLRTAVSLPVRDAYDGINHKAARDVLALLEAKDVKGARALVKKLEPFNNVG